MAESEYKVEVNTITTKEALEIGRKLYKEHLFQFIKTNSVKTKINGELTIVIDAEKLLNKITENDK